MPAITDLLTAEEMSARIKSVISPERLIELARSDIAPHYIVDGQIMFGASETKEWINHNLVTRVKGRHIGDGICRVVNVVDTVGENSVPPVSLRAIAGFLIPMGLESIETLPFSGVYFLCHRGDVVYVGQSVNVMSRVGQHFGSKTFDSVFFARVPEGDLDFVEGTFIRTLSPKYNKKAKDGTAIGPYGYGECSPESDSILKAMASGAA